MKVGIVGWRGMVGSVLLQRMQEENDFAGIEPVFFSTSQAGQPAPMNAGTLKNASDIAELKKLDVIITCQGGDYTKAVHPELRKQGWSGYWIDAASTLRMENECGHHPRSGQPQRHRRGPGQGPEGLHRRQLHRQPDADGAGRAVPRRTGGVALLHDLSGRFRRRRPQHARAALPDGGAARVGGRSC